MLSGNCAATALIAVTILVSESFEQEALEAQGSPCSSVWRALPLLGPRAVVGAAAAGSDDLRPLATACDR